MPFAATQMDLGIVTHVSQTLKDKYMISLISRIWGSQVVPRWHSGKEPACQCRLDPWVRRTSGVENDNPL